MLLKCCCVRLTLGHSSSFITSITTLAISRRSLWHIITAPASRFTYCSSFGWLLAPILPCIRMSSFRWNDCAEGSAGHPPLPILLPDDINHLVAHDRAIDLYLTTSCGMSIATQAILNSKHHAQRRRDHIQLYLTNQATFPKHVL